MTTKNNTKKFLSIIVIAIIGSMLFMACKAKPTDLNNYQVEEPAVNPTNPETPNPTNENSQKVEVKIDNNNDLRQFGEGTRENFKGYHYVSKEYMINGKPYKFTATVGWDSYQYYIQFEDGYKFYQGAGPSCKGANYKLVIQSGASRNGGACQYADVVFTTNGYLYVKFNNYSWTIEYALSKKEEVKEDNTGGNTEGHSRAELTGIWDVDSGGWATRIYVLDDGDVMYRGPWSKYYDGTGYFGKVAETFDSYPYTIKLIVTNVKHHNSGDGGTITFKSATVCEFNTTKSINKDGDLYDDINSGTKVKKGDIDSLNKTKEEIWNSVVWF